MKWSSPRVFPRRPATKCWRPITNMSAPCCESGANGAGRRGQNWLFKNCPESFHLRRRSCRITLCRRHRPHAVDRSPATSPRRRALILPAGGNLPPSQPARGIRACIDGPVHALAAVPLAIDRLDCDFYVRPVATSGWSRTVRFGVPVRPSAVEADGPAGCRKLGEQPQRHGHAPGRTTSSGRGTLCDPSPFLAVPAAIDFLASLSPGRLPAPIHRNRNLRRPPHRDNPSPERAWLRASLHDAEGVGPLRKYSAELLEECSGGSSK